MSVNAGPDGASFAVPVSRPQRAAVPYPAWDKSPVTAGHPGRHHVRSGEQTRALRFGLNGEIMRLRTWALVLAVTAVLEHLLWGVLSAVNGRSFAYLVDQNELTAAIFAVTCAVTGWVVLRSNPRQALGWIFLVIAQLEGIADLAAEYAARRPPLPLAVPALFVGNYVWLPGLAISAALITPLFPDGKALWRPLAWGGWGLVALLCLCLLFATSPDVAPHVNPIAAPVAVQRVLLDVGQFALLGCLLCGVIGIIAIGARMFRARGSERRRLGWFFVAFAIALVARALPVSPVIPAVAIGVVPAGLGIAMLRHGLFDGDRLLNRTLVCAVLTVGIAGVFGLTVGLAAGFLGGDGTGAVVAAVVIALGMAPARNLVQHTVDRLLYGQRRDPYAALTSLGNQLSAAVATDDVLSVVVGTVRDALRLPYVAVTLAEEQWPAAAAGSATTGSVDLPLRHGGRDVGTLTVGLRDRQRFLDPADERLLTGFAQQAGAAADVVRLARDLRRSRDQLAVAQEEERHRIRRDLHDGLGPTLAGVALGLDAVRRAVLDPEPETAALLSAMEAEVKGSLNDVRQLVADLRPTTLDDLGLGESLRQYAEAVTSRSGGRLVVRTDLAGLPPLPPAVEIAAYRIVLEAVTNVTRHAAASTCTVVAEAHGASLRLSVTDDGCGLPHEGLPRDSSAGLGVRSMAERAAEVGGRCVIETASGGGTLVTATLPLEQEQVGPGQEQVGLEQAS